MVQSYDLEDGELPQVNLALEARLLGVVAIVFGLILWLPGARFTVDGWTDWLSGVAGWVGITPGLARLTGWWLLGSSLVVGFVYSRIEVGQPPVSYHLRRRTIVVNPDPVNAIVWTILVGSDVGTTFRGLRYQDGSMPLWVQNIGQSDGWSAVAAGILTFLPEVLIIGGWLLLWQPGHVRPKKA